MKKNDFKRISMLPELQQRLYKLTIKEISVINQLILDVQDIKNNVPNELDEIEKIKF